MEPTQNRTSGGAHMWWLESELSCGTRKEEYDRQKFIINTFENKLYFLCH